MQPNIQTRPVLGARRNRMALTAALAFSLALALPVSGYAAGEASPETAANASKRDKVVFHVTTDDPKVWNQSLNNMNQVQNVLGKDHVAIELVVNGYGIGMLQIDSVVGNRVNDAVANGIKVVACEETMRTRRLTRDDMLKSVGYVPGGVIEVIQKQQAGYAYLKP